TECMLAWMRLTLTASALALTLSALASAETVRVEFSGTFTAIDGAVVSGKSAGTVLQDAAAALKGLLQVGSPFSGSFSFDSAVTPYAVIPEHFTGEETALYDVLAPLGAVHLDAGPYSVDGFDDHLLPKRKKLGFYAQIGDPESSPNQYGFPSEMGLTWA